MVLKSILSSFFPHTFIALRIYLKIQEEFAL